MMGTNNPHLTDNYNRLKVEKPNNLQLAIF